MLRRIAAAWAGAALFAISLGYFAYVYMVRLGRDAQATESSSAAALAIDVLTFEGPLIKEITAFISPEMFPRFGLPSVLEA